MLRDVTFHGKSLGFVIVSALKGDLCKSKLDNPARRRPGPFDGKTVRAVRYGAWYEGGLAIITSKAAQR